MLLVSLEFAKLVSQGRNKSTLLGEGGNMGSARKLTGLTRTLSMEPQERDDERTSGRRVGVVALVLSGLTVAYCPVRFSVGSGELRPVHTEPAPRRQHLCGAETGS